MILRDGSAPATPEHLRLWSSPEPGDPWRVWGSYLSERAWGTVREDYSPHGTAWEYFPHEHARSRAYRWNEDGLGGFCDNRQHLCLGVALWNGADPILKERLFGLTGNEGNHGEDVKEIYHYLDCTPTHSYARMLYRYPQAAFPYTGLLSNNAPGRRSEPEVELEDLLEDELLAGRYFDVIIEYAKAGPEDVLLRVTALNRGPDSAPLHILPQLWFRNTWSWDDSAKPSLRLQAPGVVHAEHPVLGERWWEPLSGQILFTENETNFKVVDGLESFDGPAKDAFHRAVAGGERDAALMDHGTKAAAWVQGRLPPGGSLAVYARLSDRVPEHARPIPAKQEEMDAVFRLRRREADEFYARMQPPGLSADEREVQRQALAGLLWSKQFYHFDVDRWLRGDPVQPQPPAERLSGRNSRWRHLNNADIISMPDKWEYPWYAAWDLAFHTLPLALIDPEFAKQQLLLMTRAWYMHPNGQLPAYEWAFGDVNPPVHAWAAWRVYKIARKVTGQADTAFLERAFHKLMLNFTWWVNRKDDDGNNVFQGGFLGLDNIGVFDRSAPLPTGGHIEQADGTAWMGMFCLNMLAIALELARSNRVYEDAATKFFEHFIYIANAINRPHAEGGLWDEEDGFFYDLLHLPDGSYHPLRLRSFVGLIPLYAVETLEPDLLEMLPDFKRRMDWFMEQRPEMVRNIASLADSGEGERRLLSLVSENQLRRVLARMLDEAQFLSPYGLRSMSREHEARPYHLDIDGQVHTVRYMPAESDSGMFGGNSNWRGPIWFPTNYLMIESLQKFHHYCGDSVMVQAEGISAEPVNLGAVAGELSERLVRIFLKGDDGRPAFGSRRLYREAPGWGDALLFHEYFHGDNGQGLGASHQTGWTALLAKLIQQLGENREDAEERR